MIADVICSEWRSVYYEHLIAHKLRYLALSLFFYHSLYVSLFRSIPSLLVFQSSYGEAGARSALNFRVKVFAVTRTRALVDLLAEGQRGVKYKNPRLRADEQERIGRALGRESEEE